MFTGPPFTYVDLSLQKIWKFKERYSAQFRFEVYNVFNHVNYAQFSDGVRIQAAAAASLRWRHLRLRHHRADLGRELNRQMQFGLKFLF